jgi:hypothetical protein
MAKAIAAFNINAFLDKEKPKESGSNFTGWHRNARIILSGCKKSFVLDAPLGDALMMRQLETNSMSMSRAVMTI